MPTSARPLTDYEKYIRTSELLALQKPATDLAHHDELQFQIVHQVAELWMKLCEHEVGFVAAAMKKAQLGDVLAGLERLRRVQTLLRAQLDLLDTMSPRAYMAIREVLGRGSGQESPGFRAMCRLPEMIWPAFEELIGNQKVTLRQIYESPETHRTLFLVAEGLCDFDQNLQLWRQRHLMLVFRQIGAGTPSLKGKPSDLLAEGMKHQFFPRLWEVRDELFAEWTSKHPHGSNHSYHG